MIMDMDDHPHMDVLQNIEFSVTQIFRKHPELTDFEVDLAYQTIYQNYRGEANNREGKIPSNPLSAEVYHAVRAVCEWRLGRDDVADKKGRKVELPENNIEVEAITDCLKVLRKSLRLWTKQGGKQGYLNYINQFL